ncbi:MAG TPA: YciI family protein [Gammaproteobacteria bacterium]
MAKPGCWDWKGVCRNAVAAALLLAASAAAEDAPKDSALFVILYKQGPAWKEGVPMKQQDAIGAHYLYMKKLFQEGTILDAGPTLDEPGGVVVLKAKDLADAKTIMAADPSITREMFTGEVHSWSPTFHAAEPLMADAAALKPERTVQGNVVSSKRDPAVAITLPASAAYAGADRWILQTYFDDIELHAFVGADKDKQVQRLYWVQFEAYLPSHPEYHHTYDSARHVMLGGLDFLVDTWAETLDSKDGPDSDTAHLKALLVKQGYALPQSMILVRFVHLMDGGRKELMVIYSEPAPAGLTAADLKKGGKAYGQWPGIEKGLIERGRQSVQLR